MSELLYQSDVPLTHAKIAVGSKNPVKFNASVEGAKKALKIDSIKAEGFNVPSGVSDQPIGDKETKLGAINRAQNAFEAYKIANDENPTFSIGLEGGVTVNDDNEMECYAWIAVFDGAKMGLARTAAFLLPHTIRDLVFFEGKNCLSVVCCLYQSV